MNAVQTLIQNDYEALRAGAALQLRSNNGPLVLTDADRSDFLHRMTSNNINALKPGQAAVTVLTNPTARVVFVFTVVCRADALWLLPAAGEVTALGRHLRGQIFFMDKVKVRDASAEFCRLRVMGAGATAKLATLGFDPTHANDGAWQEQEGVVVVKQLAYDVPGYEVLAPLGQQTALLEQLNNIGVVNLADDTAYHALRVELGRPLPGHELTGEYNPLEAGLAWACADNKGCYTGQEIIARQITYDKVTKTLVGLWSTALLPVGALLLAEGREVGVVTSAVYSPALAARIALAVVKRPYNQPGQILAVDDTVAEVVTLPFS